MVDMHCGPAQRRTVNRPRAAGLRLGLGLLICLVAAGLRAEQPTHFEHAGVLAPGAIGRQQLTRGGPLPGYFQPVEIQAPEGASVSLAVADQFTPPLKAPLKAGMLIGSVYRLKVSGIPRREGIEVFPTIEVVDRLYPPQGQELRFPIPIELDLEDLYLAIDGKFVTRVIYLEDPKHAAPLASAGQHQSWYEVAPHDDPLVVADRLGRPMAILRIGSRVPTDSDQPGAEFMYHSPPLLQYTGQELVSEEVAPPKELPPQPIKLRDRSQPAPQRRPAAEPAQPKQPAPTPPAATDTPTPDAPEPPSP